MKKLLVILLLLAGVSAAHDSTTGQIATGTYYRLSIDTVGNARMPRSMMHVFAQKAVEKVGWDLGVETSKPCTSSANKSGMLVDTALIQVVSVIFDSLGAPRRALIEIPVDSANKYRFSSVISKEINATHYAIWGDSLILMPASADADVFEVRYWKKATYMADTTTVVNLPEEYRDMAELWTAYQASERLQNGRADEFTNRYREYRIDILSRRLNRTSVEKIK